MTRYTDVLNAYETRRTAFTSRVGEAVAVEEQAKDLTAKADALLVEHATAERVAALFQSYSDAEHEDLRKRVGDLVTMGLQSVFGPELSFRLLPGVSRGQATIEFEVVSEYEGEELSSPILEARGGGVAALVGVLLRVVVIALHPDHRRKLLVLDESLGMVSREYHAGVAELLRRLVDEVGIQIILITHAPEQGDTADKAYRLSHDGDRTIVHEVAPAEI